MPKRKQSKTGREVTQVDRERELRGLIKQVERKKSGSAPPKKESPHDFIERRMRIKPKPNAGG
jgi:hypothetical protein